MYDMIILYISNSVKLGYLISFASCGYYLSQLPMVYANDKEILR